MAAQYNMISAKSDFQNHQQRSQTLGLEPEVGDLNTSGISRQHECFMSFKFISEERLNRIAHRVQYDRRKKLEDKAWSTFLANKIRPKLEITDGNDHNDQTISKQTEFKKCHSSLPALHHQNQSDLEEDPCISYNKQTELALCVEHPLVPDLLCPESEIISHTVQVMSPCVEESIEMHGSEVPVQIMQLDSSCDEEQNGKTPSLVITEKSHAAEEERSTVHSAISVLDERRILGTSTLNDDVIKCTCKSSPKMDDESSDCEKFLSNRRGPTQVGTLYETNSFLNVDKRTLDRLKGFWMKMIMHLDGILSFCVKAPELDDSEECMQLKRRGLDFVALFGRNYVYSLRRKIQELHELNESAANVVNVPHQNARHINKTLISLIAAHQAANSALIAYMKHMPSCLVGDLPDKLNELLQLIIGLCTLCNIFGIKQNGPNEVKEKCTLILLQIQNQKIRDHLQIQDQKIRDHNSTHGKPCVAKLARDEKKRNATGTMQKRNNKNKHYSLAMYVPTVPLQVVPKGFKNKIKNLAKAKFGPPPQRRLAKPGNGMNQVRNLKTQQVVALPVGRKVEQHSLQTRTRTLQKKQELVGKFDDGDCIQTLVEMFGQEKVEIDQPIDSGQFQCELPNELGCRSQKPLFTEYIQEDKILEEIPVANKKVEMQNVHSNQRIVKLGAPNAQLILLPPYQKPDHLYNCKNSNQKFDNQNQTSSQDNASIRQGAWQEQLQQRYSQPKQSEMKETNQLQYDEDIKEIQVFEEERLQTPHHIPSDNYTHCEQKKGVIENISASISNLEISHANLSEQILYLQKQQDMIRASEELHHKSSSGDMANSSPHKRLKKSNANNVKETEKTENLLDVPKQQVVAVLKYVKQCEIFSNNSSIHQQRLKPWRVLARLSNQLVDNVLRNVVKELDFDSLLSAMYNLEFQ